MGGKSTTTKSENNPPAWAKPLFEMSAQDAAKLYENDKGFNVYGGDRVADLNPMQLSALKGMGGMGDMAKNMAYGVNRWNDMYGQTGDLTKGIRYGEERYDNLYGQTKGPSYAEQNLGDIAAGKSLMNSPEFKDMLAQQSGEIANQVNLGAAGAGRYGSGMHTGTLGNEIGNFQREALVQNYANETQRQLAANQMMEAQKMGRIGAGTDITNAMVAGQQAKFGNRAQALGMGMNAQQALDAQRQQRFQNILTGNQAGLQAGTFKQGQRQAEMDARMQAWKERDMRDWTRLGALQSAAAGAAGPYGMAWTQQRQPFNPLGLLGSLFGLAA